MIEAQITKKKKKWFSILAGPEFDNTEVGETLSNEDANLIGRTLEVNLANITNDPKSQNIKVKFKIKEVKNNQCCTELVSYNMLSTYVKRVIKPAKEKIDYSAEYLTNDNIKILIKLIMLTKAKTIHTVLTSIRHKSNEYLKSYCKKVDYKTLVIDLVSHNLQKELKNTLKKIYPLSVCEIRTMQRL
jgi:small subunit ribosomal protein S3Ae